MRDEFLHHRVVRMPTSFTKDIVQLGRSEITMPRTPGPVPILYSILPPSYHISVVLNVSIARQSATHVRVVPSKAFK